MTYGFLLGGNPPVYCDGCIVSLSVYHIFCECLECNNQHERHFRSVEVTLINVLCDIERRQLPEFLLLYTVLAPLCTRYFCTRYWRPTCYIILNDDPTTDSLPFAYPLHWV